MHPRHLFLFLISIGIIVSCKKEGIETISFEGVVKDDVSQQPLAGVSISVDAIKSPTGTGIVTDGKRETVGRTRTDANGRYKVQLNVFKEAERLEFWLNPGQPKEGYVDRQQDIYKSDLIGSGSIKMDFSLSPTALLKIRFKNASPVSEADFFYFSRHTNSTGSTKGVLQKENCGSVPASEALTWTGKDVCGTFTEETIAEQYTHVYWTVKKSGITKQYQDSVFIKRGRVNEFSINY